MSLTIEGFCGGENVTPEVIQQETIIQNITEALVGKVYGANATPETILKGYSAYVHQELVEGTMEAGITGVDYGKVTISSAQASITVNHGLEATPRYAYLMADDVAMVEGYNVIALSLTRLAAGSGHVIYGLEAYNKSTASQTVPWETTDADSNSITFNQSSSSGTHFAPGSYNWIALA